ncbi:MAG: hypothetical protein QNJ56_02130 [Gammaproteobacteria bacterium]|nr:hypothetical protein [Gammaproteobacteria bacterium]
MFGNSIKKISTLKKELKNVEQALKVSNSRVYELEILLAINAAIFKTNTQTPDRESEIQSYDISKDGIGGYLNDLIESHNKETLDSDEAHDRHVADAIRMMDPIRKGFEELAQHIPKGHKVKLGYSNGRGDREHFSFDEIQCNILPNPSDRSYRCNYKENKLAGVNKETQLFNTPEEVIKFVVEKIAEEISLKDMPDNYQTDEYKSSLKDEEIN